MLVRLNILPLQKKREEVCCAHSHDLTQFTVIKFSRNFVIQVQNGISGLANFLKKL